MTYHAMFSLYIMTGLLALVISVSLFCKSVAEANGKEHPKDTDAPEHDATRIGECYRRNQRAGVTQL